MAPSCGLVALGLISFRAGLANRRRNPGLIDKRLHRLRPKQRLSMVGKIPYGDDIESAVEVRLSVLQSAFEGRLR